MKTRLGLGLALAGACLTLATGAGAAEVNKTYLRKGDQEVRVFTHEGKLYCRRTSDNFEMCYGMEESAAGTWTGANMKHPDMPKFMTFDGTVVVGSNKKLSIKGCMVGGAVCDEEIWDEQ
jgi:uncharacterized protein (DUF2147 family)